MDIKVLNAAIKEAEKIERRIDKLLSAEDSYYNFLCRSSDSCWENVNADEKYQYYLDLMERSGQRLGCLNNAKEHLEEVIKCFSILLNTLSSQNIASGDRLDIPAAGDSNAGWGGREWLVSDERMEELKRKIKTKLGQIAER